MYINILSTLENGTYTLFIQTTIVLAVLAACTRFISGRDFRPDESSDGNPHQVATLPYWIPYLGHLPSLIFSPTRFLQRCRCVRRPLLSSIRI